MHGMVARAVSFRTITLTFYKGKASYHLRYSMLRIDGIDNASRERTLTEPLLDAGLHLLSFDVILSR